MSSHNKCSDNDEKSKIILLKGRRGKAGDPGFQGSPTTGIGEPTSQFITPINNTSVLKIDPNKDLVVIDTSNFSPTLTLGAPQEEKCEEEKKLFNSYTHYLEVKLLYQWGLAARIQLISGGTLELSPSNPNALLFWDGKRWNIINDVANTTSFYPDSQNMVIIEPTDNIGMSSFGGSYKTIALSADGSTLAVAGPGDNNSIGATWIYIRCNSVWIEQAKLVGTGGIGESNQGSSVALSADGNTLAVGGPIDNGLFGATWVFVRIGGVWTQQGPKLIGTGAIGTVVNQGVSVALSSDGNTLAIGGWGDDSLIGATWIFVRSGGVWTQQTKIVATDNIGASYQGYSIDLSADGNTLAIGSWGDNSNVGAVWIYTRFDGNWSEQAKLVATGGNVNNVGYYVSISADGNTVAVGEEYTGMNAAIFIFVRGNGGVWSQQAGPLIPVQPASDPIVGPTVFSNVALTADGNTLTVRGYSNNSPLTVSTWIFKRLEGIWTQFGVKLATPVNITTNVPDSLAISSDGSVYVAGFSQVNNFVGAVVVYR